jgi:hypothetical protein
MDIPEKFDGGIVIQDGKATSIALQAQHKKSYARKNMPFRLQRDFM